MKTVFASKNLSKLHIHFFAIYTRNANFQWGYVNCMNEQPDEQEYADTLCNFISDSPLLHCHSGLVICIILVLVVVTTSDNKSWWDLLNLRSHYW